MNKYELPIEIPIAKAFPNIESGAPASAFANLARSLLSPAIDLTVLIHPATSLAIPAAALVALLILLEKTSMSLVQTTTTSMTQGEQLIKMRVMDQLVVIAIIIPEMAIENCVIGTKSQREGILNFRDVLKEWSGQLTEGFDVEISNFHRNQSIEIGPSQSNCNSVTSPTEHQSAGKL